MIRLSIFSTLTRIEPDSPSPRTGATAPLAAFLRRWGTLCLIEEAERFARGRCAGRLVEEPERFRRGRSFRSARAFVEEAEGIVVRGFPGGRVVEQAEAFLRRFLLRHPQPAAQPLDRLQ
ncbi:hypothetical protein K652_00895 [Pseudomonas aeruginosa VRFPA02]|nr:hypothetical protein K652_00895 [Pseudomonas aeruginosa VRFPA02]